MIPMYAAVLANNAGSGFLGPSNDTEHMKKLASSIGDGFFYNAVVDCLSDKKTVRDKADVLNRALKVMDRALLGLRFEHHCDEFTPYQIIVENGDIHGTYKKVKEAMPQYMKDASKDEESTRKVLEDVRGGLLEYGSFNDYDKEKVQHAIDLFKGLMKEADSRSSSLTLSSMG